MIGLHRREIVTKIEPIFVKCDLDHQPDSNGSKVKSVHKKMKDVLPTRQSAHKGAAVFFDVCVNAQAQDINEYQGYSDVKKACVVLPEV